MTHYDVLGVRREATGAEVRRAYLRMAREHHPDRHASSPAEVRVAAERRMRSINEAWAELGDPVRRRRYDELLDLAPTDAVVEEDRPFTWRPYDDGWGIDDPDDLDPRLDDTAGRRPVGGRLLALVPATAVAGGAATLLLGALIAVRPLVAIGAAALAIGILMFVAAPVAVVLESRRHDRI